MTAAMVHPGVYDLPAEEYHQLPHLSSTGARKLLPPSCPALFRHWRQHPELPKDHFDFGTAVHTLVLGRGPKLVYIDHEEWRTKVAKELVADVRDSGAVPVRPSDWAAVHAAGAAVRRHPVASVLFTGGLPEQTMIWHDEATGVVCRGMADYLRGDLIIDLKTCQCAHPDAIAKSIANYGYHQQAAWYLEGYTQLAADEQLNPRFLFVFVEKDPPHLITIAQPDQESLEVGAARNRRALEVFRDCTEAGVWPGYTTDVELISLPRWAARDFTWEYS